ncbi:hypothetical protein [Natronosalvus rutilus]|uniref:DUF7995 domain-containing protein n=1 Tax=Natronosalvus rutilus TaxID=2953753 RepID=A0A9E7NF11_9EURY|nr:hypothetical protein [Natronosalvus rutilus]UTF55805.1 hypothetical protein NGM29_19210 [Natronosalvus rutilus]
MTDRYADFEELRPLGEATQIPDDELARDRRCEPFRDRTEETLVEYPNDPVPPASECTSCGASIPASQTKCRFCLTNHLGVATDKQQPLDTEWTLLHVVHLLVEASTNYHALAKGAAAATLLAKPDRDPAVNDCQLIYDFDTKPATQLTDKWPSLPEAVQVTSESGEQLLTAARERTGQTESTQSRHEGAHTTFLYDEGGHDVHDEDQVTALLETVEDDIWLVPAIALQCFIDDEHSENRQPSVLSKTRLDCRTCGRKTEHQFQRFESLPDETWSGQPIWECQVCQSPRHGPAPK